MISDILFEAVVGLEYYLNDSFYDRIYCGDLRERITLLRDEAKYVQVLLDTHPCDTPPPETVLRDRIAADRRQAREHAQNGGDNQ
jgi:hypothetical protein